MKRSGSFLLGVVSGFVLFAAAGLYYVHTLSVDSDAVRTSAVQVDIQSLFGDVERDLSTISTGSSYIDPAKYEAIYELLSQQYVYNDKLDLDKMQENAVKGFVNALGDPYTSYLNIEENKMFDEELQGSQNFEGIGAVVTKKDQGVLIEELIKGGPAYQAGLKPLDIVLEVDGMSMQPLTITEAVQEMRGPKGTEVVLTIYRESTNEILDITVVRDEISVPSVDAEIIETTGHNLLYLEVAVFGSDTRNSFRELVRQYYDQADGVILDLRGNGGGYLPIASELASYFLEKDELVTYTQYKNFPDETFTSKGYEFLQGIPVVVLVDGISASASEILAAALRDRAGATIVGTQTFGKGSIQTLHEMSDGSLLKYSVGMWYTPDGHNVDEEGLTPDVEVEFDREQYLSGNVDNQLQRAQEVLLENIQSN